MQDFTLRLDRLKSTGKDHLLMVHTSTNNTVLQYCSQIDDFRELRSILRKKNFQSIFSGSLSIAQAKDDRREKIPEVNRWKDKGYSMEGFVLWNKNLRWREGAV